MKKRGSALAMVLIMTAAVLILGSAVSIAVVNSTKFNAKYSEYIDLELAAKSCTNVTVEFIAAYIKDKTSDEIKNYISKFNLDVLNRENLITKTIKKYRDDNNTNVEITVAMDGDSKISITSTSNEIGNDNVKKIDKQIIELNIEETVVNKVDLDALVNVMLDNRLVLLQAENKSEYFNIDSDRVNNIYIQPLTSLQNNKFTTGTRKLYAPKLKMNYGTYNTSKGELSSLLGAVKDNNDRVIGKAINLEGTGYKLILINGDLNFDTTIQDALNKSIVYVTGKVTSSVSSSKKLTIINSSITSKSGFDVGNKVQISSGDVPINGEEVKRKIKAEIREWGVDIPEE